MLISTVAVDLAYQKEPQDGDSSKVTYIHYRAQSPSSEDPKVVSLKGNRPDDAYEGASFTVSSSRWAVIIYALQTAVRALLVEKKSRGFLDVVNERAAKSRF